MFLEDVLLRDAACACGLVCPARLTPRDNGKKQTWEGGRVDAEDEKWFVYEYGGLVKRC